jgi:polynucleotide 5'-hydroxyl-kinase GRC3/NOL9
MDRLLLLSRSKPISVMITGPKSSGKSTFGKILTNQLLTAALTSSKKRRSVGVAILDLDPGQPERCIAGQVALVHVTEPFFGPSFGRPLPDDSVRVVRSHTLASITPASDPNLYLQAASDLLNHHRNRLRNCHLIINTAGWIQGTGLDLLTALITNLRPTEVLYMSTGPTDVVEALQDSFRNGQLVTLPSQSTQNTARTPAQLRTMQTMSYFHAEAEVTKPGLPLSWNPGPLSALPPWQLKYAGVSPGILGVMCYDYQAPAELLAEAINGTLLAVVEIENALAFRKSAAGVDKMAEKEMDVDGPTQSIADTAKDLETTTPEGIPFLNAGSTLDPRYSQTIGLLLVRGIDTEKRAFHVLTPISAEKIEQVNKNGCNIVLVSGKFDVPNWAYTEDLYHEASLSHDGEEAVDDEMDATGDEHGSQQGEDEEEEEVGEGDADGGEASTTNVPWIEVLHGNQRRGVGSKVWRVRRDLGRTGSGA